MPDYEAIATAIQTDAETKLGVAFDTFRSRLNDICLAFAREIGVPEEDAGDFTIDPIITGPEAQRLLIAVAGTAYVEGVGGTNTAGWPDDLSLHRIARSETAFVSAASSIGLTI